MKIHKTKINSIKNTFTTTVITIAKQQQQFNENNNRK